MITLDQAGRVRAWSPGRPALAVITAVAIVVVSAGSARTAHAQTTVLQGRVSDATGQPLPQVTVTAKPPAGDAVHTHAADDGRYRLEGLAAGTYEVSFSMTGFATTVLRAVAVPEGRSTTLDASLYLSASASVVVLGRSTFRDLSSVSSAEELIGVAESATSGVITPGDLDERSRRRPGEALERVPGVIVSQHSGEGKANQYYIRGFNIDHGTDLALSVSGMPVNLPTHGHGQGYADLSFLLPELVGSIQYRKGPYFADEGDFSAAGSMRIKYVNVLERPIGRLEVGHDGYVRGLFAASPRVGRGHLLIAAETTATDGPWSHPDDYRRWNGMVRFSQGTATSGFSLTGLFYDGTWNSTDQIPRRAVESGRLGRFDAVDPTGGGRSHRAGGIVEWQRTGATNQTRVEGYGFDYGLSLYSNFTYALDDPEQGDQFEQRDERAVLGARVSHLWSGHLAGIHSEVAVGAEVRHDDIGAVGLYRTRARQRLSTTREDAVGQTSGALHGQLTSRWTESFRTILGVRADRYRFDVRAGDPANGGTASDGITNPKFGAVFGPWRRTELYVNAGGGFHSNDGRGATIRRDPVTGDPVDPVDPLVRAKGAEIGLRTLAIDRLHTSIAAWGLWLDSELLFIGDAGTTGASRPSRRRGFEWSADYAPRRWLSLDSSVAWSWARFTDADPAGNRIPGAVEGVAAAGATVTPNDRWSGRVQWRYFGPRPLVEDDSVRSDASSLVNAEVGYRVAGPWRVKVDLLNLFDAQDSDVDYYYTSRLPGEPAGGVDDVHFHPVEPFTVRVALVASF
jgi:TonB dependent receptor/Carboxypeptidase regulatory-like domain/TonB-dependent Receptor Plug Domain